MKKMTLVLAFLPVGFAAMAHAAGSVVVDTNGVTAVRDCEGGDAVVTGNGNLLAFLNCRSLSVSGSRNRIDSGVATAVTLLGDENQIDWHAAPGDPAPKVSNSGKGNVVAAAVPTTTAHGATGVRVGEAELGTNGAHVRDAHVDGSGVHVGEGVAVDGDGVRVGDAKVDGDGARVGDVKVDGGGVRVGSGISVGADGVRVGNIQIGGLGATGGDVPAGNEKVKAGAGSGPFMMSENHQHLTYDCHGGDATIDGEGNVLTLRNCVLVTIRGDGNTIDAGSPRVLSLLGDGNKVSWRDAAEGTRLSDVGDGNKTSRK